MAIGMTSFVDLVTHLWSARIVRDGLSGRRGSATNAKNSERNTPMKPKDLLKELEKGDRTMEHLAGPVSAPASPQPPGTFYQGGLGQALDYGLSNQMAAQSQAYYGMSSVLSGNIVPIAFVRGR